MERVLLWLDEFDDWLSMSAHSLTRVRLLCLRAGLAGALGLPLAEAAPSVILPNACISLAVVSVLIWTAAAAAELAAGLRAGFAAQLEKR